MSAGSAVMDVIAWRQRLKDGHGCSGPRAERGRNCTAFECADPALQGFPIGIVVARVHETARVRAIDVALERCGKVNWGGDCPGCRVNVMPGVNG